MRYVTFTITGIHKRRCLAQVRKASPMTNEPMERVVLPNQLIKTQIVEWREQQQQQRQLERKTARSRASSAGWHAAALHAR